MPRQARERSSSGIYHIMLRGINRQDIFHDEEDKMRFIETLKNYKSICEV
ncbi:transposase [Petroclostridium xylanilyticum]|jgi:REP element-mobilizing transposase RayT